MSFFLKGDFKIQESWEQKPPSRGSNSRQKGRQKQKNKSLVNAGKNIIAQPTTDMLDDELSKRILKQFADQLPPASIKSEKKVAPKKEEASYKMPPKQKSSAPQSENDLLTVMTGRLKTVQMTCKNQRQQIKQKSETIEKLKAENSFLKGMKEDSTQEFQKMKNLQSDNEEMKKKIEQMEVYLKKYGLKWVGNKLEGSLEHQQMKKDLKKNYNYRLPTQIDINTIMRRVQQLNGGLHSEGMGTEVYQQNGVHKFKKAQALPIGFFSNGIAIKGYKFFSYKSKESLQILGDLTDGYFPYILKGKYPNGVFMKVVDKVAQKYNDQSSQEGINTFESNQNKDFRPQSKDEFLSQLPKQVVKNGKIINIRSEIEKKFNGEQKQTIKQVAEDEQSEHYTKQEGITVFKTREDKNLRENKITEMQICTLKIRNEKGEVYILHLSKEHTVQSVYSWMQKVHRQKFTLMSNYPKRSYEQDQPQSLEDLGFYPNAMLHIHASK